MTAEEMLAMRGVAKNAWGEEESRPCYKRGHSGQRATGIALGADSVGLRSAEPSRSRRRNRKKADG